MPPVSIPRPPSRPWAPGPATVPVRPQAERPPEHAFGFGLFLLVNLALFVRPADVHPALVGIEFYQYLILLCFAVSFPAVLERLSPVSLEKNPIDVCVLCLLPAIMMSNLVGGRVGEIFSTTYEYFKFVIYYLLLIGLVTTPGRLRIFTGTLILFASVTTLLSLLDFYQYIRLPRLIILGREQLQEEGRMYGPGIFADPNDLCVMIAVSLILLLSHLTDRRQGAARIFWLPCLAIFILGFHHTQSRGGLLALMAGVGMFIVLRFSWRTAILLGILGIPLLGLLGARQTAISLGTTTGQERMYLWSDGLDMFRESPLFGVGWGAFAERSRLVAHNAYINVLAELGLVGGVFFVGAWYLAIRGMYRLGQSEPATGGQLPVARKILDPELARVYPYIAGALTAYAAGMLTLSLEYIVPTYAFLGMASMFLARAQAWPAVKPLRFDMGLLLRMSALCLVYMAAVYAFLRFGMRA